jgi:hypothetical protein
MYNSQRCAVSWANNPAQQQHMPVKVNNKERKDPAQLCVSYLKEKKTHLSPKIEQRASSKHKQGARWKPCQFKKDTWNSKKHFDIRNKTQTHYKIKKYTVRYFMPSKKNAPRRQYLHANGVRKTKHCLNKRSSNSRGTEAPNPVDDSCSNDLDKRWQLRKKANTWQGSRWQQLVYRVIWTELLWILSRRNVYMLPRSSYCPIHPSRTNGAYKPCTVRCRTVRVR